MNKAKNHDMRNKLRNEIGQRIKSLRNSLPWEKRQLKEFAQMVDVSESVLSRIESGKASLPLDAVERIAKAIGCRKEVITEPKAYLDIEKNPLRCTIEFLQQAEILGVDGLFRDRTSALGYLLSFAEKMYGGEICITGSSLRGLEQKSEHGFVRKLEEFGNNPQQFKINVIMTHPKLGPNRDEQEHRPSGSIVREIFTGINWCLDVLHIPPDNIRLSQVSPSSFSIFLLDGTEGRGIINPYPTMRQAFLSYTLGVRIVSEESSAVEAVSIFQTYIQANFREPWGAKYVTVDLKTGLRECIDIIDEKGYEFLEPHHRMLEKTLERCEKKKE